MFRVGAKIRGGRETGNTGIYFFWLKEPSFLHVDMEDSDQAGRMPRLI